MSDNQTNLANSLTLIGMTLEEQHRTLQSAVEQLGFACEVFQTLSKRIVEELAAVEVAAENLRAASAEVPEPEEQEEYTPIASFTMTITKDDMQAALEQRADALDIYRAPCETNDDFEARVEQEEAHLKNCATPPCSEPEDAPAAPKRSRRSVMTDENIAAVRELVEAVMSGADIAAETGLSTSQVYHIVKSLGLTLRGRGVKSAVAVVEKPVQLAPKPKRGRVIPNYKTEKSEIAQ